jgi:hypothetical protein
MSALSKEDVVPTATELPIKITTHGAKKGTTVQGDSRDADRPVSPPNGGWVAWLQVSGSFVLYFNTL